MPPSSRDEQQRELSGLLAGVVEEDRASVGDARCREATEPAVKRSTPLRARKAFRRTSPMRRRRGTTKYSRRERDFEFMGWVKRQPCIVRSLPPVLYMSPERAATYKAATPCNGRVEADHMGARGIGQKAPDRTCVSMCFGHHGERTNHAGTFRPLVQEELRAWRAEAIARTQAAWSNR